METEMVSDPLTLEELGSIERDILDYVRNAPHFQECAPRIKACFAAARAHLEGQAHLPTDLTCPTCGTPRVIVYGRIEPTMQSILDEQLAQAEQDGRTLPQPPQQREDEITGPTGYHDSVSALLHRTGGADGDGGSPAPSSTVDHKRGLACRELSTTNNWCATHNCHWGLYADCCEAAAALEAKDAEIKRLCDQWPSGDERAAQAQVEIEQRIEMISQLAVRYNEAQAEIGRLKKGWNFAECDSKEAQAEIERLREALDCVLKYHCPNIQSVAVDRARAALKPSPAAGPSSTVDAKCPRCGGGGAWPEIARLRKTLEVLSVAPAVDCKFCKETARMARAALKGGA
jgi:ssDNA-binding Zn-finger/Zn-ribbon topoisomerase 1